MIFFLFDFSVSYASNVYDVIIENYGEQQNNGIIEKRLIIMCYFLVFFFIPSPAYSLCICIMHNIILFIVNQLIWLKTWFVAFSVLHLLSILIYLNKKILIVPRLLLLFFRIFVTSVDSNETGYSIVDDNSWCLSHFNLLLSFHSKKSSFISVLLLSSSWLNVFCGLYRSSFFLVFYKKIFSIFY